MKHLHLRILPLLLIALYALSGCRATRKIQTAINTKVDSVVLVQQALEAARADSIRFIRGQYDSAMAHRIDFVSFNGKVDLEYEEPDGKKLNVNAQIRMQKDSLIWISLTAIFGIEGVRACITADSVKILDKQNKTYLVRSIAYLQEITALPLDLHSLQDLLIGNPVFLDSSFNTYSRGGGTISIQGSNTWFRQLLTFGESDKLISSYKLDDLDVNRRRSSYLAYADYEKKLGPWFARRRTVQVAEKKNLSIRLNYKQYAFNETLSFPFVVPKNYKIE